MIRVLRYEDGDNVVTAMSACSPGDELFLGDQPLGITAAESIPSGHKIACTAIPEGSYAIKCKHTIGVATRDIQPGQHVHTHNLADRLTGASLDDDYILDPGSQPPFSPAVTLDALPELYGFRRKNGLVGFRNHLLVISTVICANQPLTELRAADHDVIVVENPSGCIILPNEVERVKAVILGLARNPNVGAVIYVGLGCELVGAEYYYEQTKDEKPSAWLCMQDDGSSDATYDKLTRKVAEFKALLAQQKREPASLSDIVFGTKCGGSDWTTTAVSNPAIGMVSDLIVKNGGSSFLGETNGLTGGQDLVLARARSQTVCDDILTMLRAIYARSLAVGHRLEEGNPSPGNKAGGITTLKEKALGNVLKSGSAPVEGVLQLGKKKKKKGLYVVDNPGLDPLSLIGLTCSGANLLVYSTGRGSPVGTPVAPSIKLTASDQAMRTFSAHMDVDLTSVTNGEISLEEGALILFNELIAVANGKLVKAEQKRHQEATFPLLMGSL